MVFDNFANPFAAKRFLKKRNIATLKASLALKMVVAITNQLLRILVVYEFLSSVIRRKLLNLWN